MKPKHLFIINDKLHVHSDDEKTVTLQQGDLLGREGRPDSLVIVDRQDAIHLRAALGEWLKAGQPPVVDEKERQVLLMQAKLEAGDCRDLVIFGMSEAAWNYCKDGDTHTFDLRKAIGVPLLVVITGGPNQETIVDNLNAGANIAGASFEDKRKKVPTIGIDEPTKQ